MLVGRLTSLDEAVSAFDAELNMAPAAASKHYHRFNQFRHLAASWMEPHLANFPYRVSLPNRRRRIRKSHL